MRTAESSKVILPLDLDGWLVSGKYKGIYQTALKEHGS
jgi:hypothetical protein